MQAALSIERFHSLRGEGLESLLTKPAWFYVEWRLIHMLQSLSIAEPRYNWHGILFLYASRI